MTSVAAATATVGVDVGGSKILSVLLGEGGAVLAQRQRPVPAPPADRPASALLDAVGEALAALTTEADGRGVTVVGAGVGLPGLVDDGVVRGSPHRPEVVGVDVAANLRARTGLSVVVDNDATCAALAEWQLGVGQGCRDLLVVAVGTGIGAGMVVGGQLARGARGFAGEAGHLVVDPHGPLCPCGRRGCWEGFGSGDALGDRARRAAAAGGLGGVVARAGGVPAAVRGEHVTEAARDGDGEAAALLAEQARWLSLGVANLLVVLDSERVVLAGGVAAAGGAVTRPLAAELGRAGALPAGRPAVPVVVAHYGAAAGAVGAAWLARLAHTAGGRWP